jgi:hypothetical protein
MDGHADLFLEAISNLPLPLAVSCLDHQLHAVWWSEASAAPASKQASKLALPAPLLPSPHRTGPPPYGAGWLVVVLVSKRSESR